MGVKLYFTLRQEYRMRAFENMVLRGLFGPDKEEMTDDWTRLHNEKLHSFNT